MMVRQISRLQVGARLLLPNDTFLYYEGQQKLGRKRVYMFSNVHPKDQKVGVAYEGMYYKPSEVRRLCRGRLIWRPNES